IEVWSLIGTRSAYVPSCTAGSKCRAPRASVCTKTLPSADDALVSDSASASLCVACSRPMCSPPLGAAQAAKPTTPITAPSALDPTPEDYGIREDGTTAGEAFEHVRLADLAPAENRRGSTAEVTSS